MERLAPDAFEKSSLADEHTHRYRFAARVARGNVVDCACGIGYGSQFLAGQERVRSYLGVDPSTDAIAQAQMRSTDGVRFALGSLENLPAPAGSVDTFVMLETLEHVVDPSVALLKVREAIAADGLLVGSVPSKEYEELCERAYSPNPYHLQRFSLEELTGLLGAHFEAHLILAAEFQLGTLFRPLSASDAPLATAAPSGQLIVDASSEVTEGSFFFLAGSRAALARARDALGAGTQYYPGASKARTDLEELTPLRIAFESSESMVSARDESLAGQADMLEKRWAIIQEQDDAIKTRDEAIASQGKMLEERWDIVVNQGHSIDELKRQLEERDLFIVNQARTMEAHESAMTEQASLLARQSRILVVQERILQQVRNSRLVRVLSRLGLFKRWGL